MTFRTSEPDEAFRAELRGWLAGAVTEHGPPPSGHDRAARRNVVAERVLGLPKGA